MSARRNVYTRKEAAKLLHRDRRSMLRWEKWGWLTRLPDAPGPEILYAGPQVEALARRLRRLEEEGEADEETDEREEREERDESEPDRPRERESSRPRVHPWRQDRPPRAFTPRKTTRKPPPVAEAPQSVKRPPADPPPRSAPRPPEPLPPPPRSVPTPRVSHAPLPGDVEADKWEREIDERKRAWEEEQATAKMEQPDGPPSSSSRRG